MRVLCKRIIGIVFVIVATPLWALYRLQALVLGQSQAISAWSQLLALLPGLFGVYLRRAFYGCAMQDVGQDAVVSFGVLFSHSATSIGRSAYIGPYCVIGDAEIGDDCLIGSQVSIMNGSRQHGIERLDIPVREQPGEWPRIRIGRDTWIGDRAIVMADIGKHCVVGAGSVVTKHVEDYAIVVGNPARVIGSRRRPETTSNDSGE